MPLLKNRYTEAFTNGHLPSTLSKALISLILKNGKEPSEYKSFRPISLISMDVKILSKVLVNHLDAVITSIIHLDQVGFIRNRNLADNIRRFINVMWAVSNDNEPIAAISLDAEKAFDCVKWEYLFSTLEAFGFGQIFTKWVKLLYDEARGSGAN